MNNRIIKNARVVDPSQGLDEVLDILIQNGKIAGLGHGFPQKDAQVLDAKGLTAIPGLVDMHVHLRDPGFTHKEDILTGCEAAAAGGVCTVACMPNTKPAADTPEVLEYIRRKAGEAKAKVVPVACITQGMQGEALCDFRLLKKAGAVGVSDDGRPVENAKLMKEAIQAAARAGIPIISHCEDLKLIDGGIMNLGEVSRELGVPGMDRASEDTITSREMILAEIAGAPIHIAHVSTRGSVELIRQAKARGVKVTAETAPHYFMLTHELLRSRDADYRMNPPLREEADRQAVLKGLLDGTIDVIATDHAPHAAQEKADFLTAPNGVVGLETSLAACLTALVHTGKLSLSQLVEKMSLAPARILGIPGGTLQKGADADIALVDLNEQWTVEKDKLRSKSRNTVFKGQTFRGKVKATFLRGELVFEDR